MSTQPPTVDPNATNLQASLDSGIWYTLSLWPALNTAVAEQWGGPSSSDKRDWFAGAVSELLATRPDTDQEELEAFLLQIMQDEFGCRVEDESEVEVARGILELREKVLGEGRTEVVGEVERRWRGRGKVKVEFGGEVDQDADEDDEEWNGFDDEEGDGDVEMMDPQEAVPPPVKEKVAPEVDAEGFTKVVGRKKR